MALVEAPKVTADPHRGPGRLFVYRPSTKPDTLVFVWASLPANKQIGKAYISQIGGITPGTVAALDDVGKHIDAWGPLISGPPLAACSELGG